MKNRILWIDYAKALCIFMVVLIHTNMPNEYKLFVRIFLIPTFFFLSGLFFNTDKYQTSLSFLKDKTLKILIPYLFFNIIGFIYWFFIGRKFGVDINSDINIFTPLLGFLKGTKDHLIHAVPLWFLTCLFSVESIYYLLFRKKEVKCHFFGLLLLALIAYLDYKFIPFILPWNINIAFSMILFFGIGVLTKPYLFKKNCFDTPYKLGITLTLSFILVYMFSRINSQVLVFNKEYGNYFYFIVGAVLGIILIVSLCKLIEMCFGEIKFLQYIGENTLLILGFHLITGGFIKGLTYFIFDLPLSIHDNTWVKILHSILSIIILVPLMWFFNKYLPILVGRKK